jgi:hypothetical protein
MKNCPNLVTEEHLNTNVIELQFAKVKPTTEKKITFRNFIDLIAILSIIKYLGINSTQLSLSSIPVSQSYCVIKQLRPNKVTKLTNNQPVGTEGKSKQSRNVNFDINSTTAAQDDDAMSLGSSTVSSMLLKQSHDEISRSIDQFQYCRFRGKIAFVMKFLYGNNV